LENDFRGIYGNLWFFVRLAVFERVLVQNQMRLYCEILRFLKKKFSNFFEKPLDKRSWLMYNI